MASKSLLLGFCLVVAPSVASAKELRDFCPDRPGLGTPACTIDPKHFAVEVGLVDWTLDRPGGSRTDTIVAGDVLVRYGLGNSLEAQIGWQALGFARQRDQSGSIDHATGTGDVRLALRQNLMNPDGSGLSIAVMPFVSLPTGGSANGYGDWTAGVLLPVSYELSEGVQIAFTGEVDSLADEQASGHHLAYSGIVGLDAPITKDLTATVELAAERDEEPGQHSTQLISGASLAWLTNPSFQLDAGANLGLNRDAPDLELYLGLAKSF